MSMVICNTSFTLVKAVGRINLHSILVVILGLAPARHVHSVSAA